MIDVARASAILTSMDTPARVGARRTAAFAYYIPCGLTAGTVRIHSFEMEPVPVTRRSAHMDAPRPAEFGSTVRRTRAVRGIGTALCLFALLSLLTVRTAEVSHHPVHRAAAITAAADSSIQVRAAQPLAATASGSAGR